MIAQARKGIDPTADGLRHYDRKNGGTTAGARPHKEET